MSKKMLKRSLALGALMAFVITGSAWAGELIPNVKDGDSFTGLIEKTYLMGTGNESISIIGEPYGVEDRDTNDPSISGDFIVKDIGTVTLSGIWGQGNAAGGACEAIAAGANKTVSFSNIGLITTGSITSPSNASTLLFQTDGGKIVLTDIDNIKITSGRTIFRVFTDGEIDVNVNETFEISGTAKRAIEVNSKFSSLGSEADIKAKNVVIDVSEIGVYTRGNDGNKSTKASAIITAEQDLKISGNASDSGVLCAWVGDGKNASITLNGDNVSVTHKSNGMAIESYGGGKIVINASTANIKGSIIADGGIVDLSGIKDLVLEGLTPTTDTSSDATIQVSNGGTLNVNTDDGTLEIKDAKVGTYKVASGVNSMLWEDDQLVYDRINMLATASFDEKSSDYNIEYEKLNLENLGSEKIEEIKSQAVESVGGKDKLAVADLVKAAVGNAQISTTAPGASEFLGAISRTPEKEMSKETKAAVINSAAQLAEAGGNAGTAASVASNVSNVTTGRMSFNGGHGGAKGGHGVGLLEEGSGAAIWTQYMHGKDEATDMPMDGGATSYESEYDGIVLGVDFKKVGKFQSGIAFNYGEGDSTGFTSAANTKSDYDFWGIGYYGNIRNDDTNFIFDVNYAKSDSDVTQRNVGAAGLIEASPETTTWSAGVKVEKLYHNNNVQIVPYTGLRYMSIDTDDYKSTLAGKTLFNYAPERQDIWLLPLGVTIKQEVVNDNGWVVTPKVDLSYIWAFGDTDSNMSVSIPGIAASNDTLGFTVMDDGSFLGLVGVEATLDDWTFGVSYSYQKGDYAESKKWFVDAKYSF